MNATVKVIGKGGTKYIAIESKPNPEREGEGSRPLYTQTKDDLTYSQADKELDPFNTLGTDDYLYIVISLEPEEFQRLGTTDAERLSEFVGAVRDIMPQVAKELNVKEMNWVGGPHLNTDNPHFHLVTPKEMCDRVTGALRRVERLPAELLPKTEDLSDGTKRVVVGRISELFIAAVERRAKPVREIQIKDQAEGRVIGRAVVEPRTLDGRKPTPEERLVGQWISSEIRAACFTPDRVEEKTLGRTFEDFVRVRGERERLRKEVRKLDAERAARGEVVVPAFISPGELIGSLEGRPKTLTLSLQVKKSRDGQSNSGELRLEQEAGHQPPETAHARIELEKATEISSDRAEEKEVRNIISVESRVPDDSILHQEISIPALQEGHDLLDTSRIEWNAASMERGVGEAERETLEHVSTARELPFGGDEVVKEQQGPPAPPLTKDPAPREQLSLFRGEQRQLDFGQELTNPAPELTGVTPSPEKEELIELAHPTETQEHRAPELESVVLSVEIPQPEQARAVEADHLSDEELSRYAGWASFYSQHLEHERCKEKQALQFKLAEQDATRRLEDERELQELKNRLDLLAEKGHEAFLVDECYNQACHKRGVKQSPFSPWQRDYLGRRVKELDGQSADLVKQRFEIVKEKLPTIEHFVDPSFLDLYRKVQEKNSERNRSQDKRKQHDSQDKTETLDHETKLVGTPERVGSSKSATEPIENSRLAQQMSIIEQAHELAAMVL